MYLHLFWYSKLFGKYFAKNFLVCGQHLDICAMQIQMSPLEAWNDFFEWMKTRRMSGDIAQIPKDVQEAHYANAGRRKHPLGEKRIHALLTKYAPERYEFRAAVILRG